jgi:predicted PurR-regulated permease PerM
MTAGIVGLILNAALTGFLAAYFTIEAEQIWPTLLNWLPGSARARVGSLIAPLEFRLGGYVRGQLLVAIGVAIILVAGLYILGIKYALVLGILAGLMNVIPYVGSFIACAFAVVVAFNQAPMLAGAVLLLYVIEQWVESSFLVPIFLGHHASLHPLVVLFSIIIGASLMGLPGALISVPITSACVYLAQEFYLKRFET